VAVMALLGGRTALTAVILASSAAIILAIE
jgi:hypothetical protein